MVKLFLAGVEAFPELIIKYEPKYILTTFYIFWKKPPEKWHKDPTINIIKHIKKRGGMVFLDSGGFTITFRERRKQVPIDYLDRYVRFVKTYKKYLDIYANVDTDDPEISHNNLLYLENEGIEPWPVWRVTWPKELLIQYLKKYDYIALGGFAALKTPKKMIDWIRRHMPLFKKYKMKVHIFGLTSVNLLTKIRSIYSADSTTWINAGKYGMIPIFYNGKLKLYHWSELPESKKQYIEAICKKIGINPKPIFLGQGEELRHYSLYVWILYQNYLDNL